MTPSLFKKRLGDHGFEYQHNPHGGRFTRVVSGLQQHVARASVRGGAWRLHLAVGDVPVCWPADNLQATTQCNWDDAESPWFYYSTDLDPSDPLDAQCDSREVALEKCFRWLTTIGIQWLSEPGAKSADEWRKTYKILVRKHLSK